MKIVAIHAKCAGHARCAAIAPEVYTLNDDGYIDFGERAVPEGLAALARRGARACPERILTIEE